MLIVLVDKGDNYFTECFGVKSYAEIPLFHKNLFGFLKSGINNLFEENQVVLTENKSNVFGNSIVVSSVKELVDYINALGCKRVAFIYLNTFIFFDYSRFLSALKSNDNLFVSDKNNNVFGGVFNSNQAINLLKYSNISDLCELKKHRNFTYFNCIDGGRIINNIKDYKSLVDEILNGKYSIELPCDGNGIFCEGKIPKGDFTIVPPVYFGRDIQIEAGAVIGPYSAIYDSSLVAKNSTIKNSILLNNCFISKDCFLHNCMCCSNVSVRRASSILSGAVIGSDLLLSEKTVVESDAFITEFVINNDDALLNFISERDDVIKSESEDGTVEFSNSDFNIRFNKYFHKNAKIMLKASSFEIAEELISNLIK